MRLSKRGRGRPSRSDDVLLDYEKDESVAEPLRRLANAARQRQVSWAMLWRLGDFDPSALRRSFEAKTADAGTVRRLAAALNYPTYVQKALCKELSESAALLEARNAVRSVVPFDVAVKELRAKLEEELLSKIDALKADELKTLGTRLILAQYGLDDLFRRHRFKNARLDVLCEVLGSDLDEPAIDEAAATLDEHICGIKSVLNSIGVGFADQKRIFAILEPYAGEHIEIGEVFEKIDSNWFLAIVSGLTSRGGNTDMRSVRELIQDVDVSVRVK